MFDLTDYNTFGLSVHAGKGIIIKSLEDLEQVKENEILILGSGSDVLFADDYEGTVLINAIQGLSIERDEERYCVRAGGGLLLDNLIARLLQQDITGLENLSLIPGTVGAAPIQNVGAYGVEIGDYIESVEVYDLDSHQQLIFTRDMCEFGYRTSVFKRNHDRHWVITYVNLTFPCEFRPHLTYPGLKGELLEDAMEIRRRVIELRRRKLPDPKVIGNAGSFFKNPLVDGKTVDRLRVQYENMPVFTADNGMFKLAAGWLIEKAGLRGITHGNAGTWEGTALVLVNRGGARPHEIIALAKYICTQVKLMFDVDLEPEVRIYGRTGEMTWSQL